MRGEPIMMRYRIGLRVIVPLAALAAACGFAGTKAFARTAAAPQNTSAPTISGTAREGSTLTAANGSWSGAPTSFDYQWQRCATDGTACGDITGATKQTYMLVTGDVSHAVRVIVTAANADGKTALPSNPSDVVDAKNGPTNSVKPAVSGTAKVGEELSVSTGTWSPKPTSFTYRWQRCDDTGACRNVIDATGRTYGVRTADVDHRMRALVTAHSTGGVATTATSLSDVVASNTSTSTETTTVQGNRSPSILFVSLKRVGPRVFARFRVCDDGMGRLTIIARDVKARALSTTRRFTVRRALSCGTFSRTWRPAPRFRTHGRYIVTLRAADTSGGLSRIVSRSLVKR